MSQSEANTRAAKNQRTLLLLSLLVLLMFGFGFAMVPLYNLICQVTGVQSVQQRSSIGKTGEQIINQSAAVADRWVTVKFDATVHSELPWSFQPMQPKVRAQPGQMYQVKFLVENRSSKTVVGQAIPSVAPWQATGYLQKLDCFCFKQQTMTGGQTVEMPLQFTVSPDLPAGINSLTLSYTFMNAGSEGEEDASLPGERVGSRP